MTTWNLHMCSVIQPMSNQKLWEGTLPSNWPQAKAHEPCSHPTQSLSVTWLVTDDFFALSVQSVGKLKQRQKISSRSQLRTTHPYSGQRSLWFLEMRPAPSKLLLTLRVVREKQRTRHQILPGHLLSPASRRWEPRISEPWLICVAQSQERVSLKLT